MNADADELLRRPMPVRWYACGYRDGFTGVKRGLRYFDEATETELVAYGKGHVAGRLEAQRQERHRQLLATAELIAGC